jgi:serine/threonine protein kinase
MGVTEQLGLEVAGEMRRRWRAGQQPVAEEFFSRRPELLQRPEAAVELIYEEYCLRQSAGDEGVEEEVLRRFPQWAGPLRVMLDCHRRLLQSDRDRPRFPTVGSDVGDFRLLDELARGTRGRVFLATQTTLADRPVVLKVTSLDGGEHCSLARLQHTHIVPLYSIFDDASRNVRVLCMPYFGRATLALLLESLAHVPFASRNGQHLVAAIDRLQGPAPPPRAPDGAARQMLARVSWVQAMSWVAACLADALQFAHERGLVHLDLKPPNVLLATDGQPMLLDFHLARAPIGPGRPPPENFGGTPLYMPPEQQTAMRSLQNADPVEVTVDERADVYALGAILYESLGGRLPITADSPPLRNVNPQVSTGLADMIFKSLARRPEERYADAQGFADDLRRHLTDQPLVGVPNRAVVERWQKWRRRRPNSFRTAGTLLFLVAAAAILIAGWWSNTRERLQQARLAQRDGQAQLNAGRFADAILTFERGLALTRRLPLHRDLEQQMRDRLTAARRGRLAQQLHELADEIRVSYDANSIPSPRLRSLASQCDGLWQRRKTIVDSISPARDSGVTADLLDIAIFAADLRVKLTAAAAPEAGRRDALRLLDEAELMFGASAVIEHQRGIHRSALGIAQTPSHSSLGAAAPAPRTAWEHCVLGRALLSSGDLPHAAEQLATARELEPAGRWPNFYYGLCAYRMGRYEDAIAAFSVCIGCDPNVAGYFYNRALAYAALGRRVDALQDYERTLKIDPDHAAAALNLGVLHFQQNRYDRAIACLGLALEHGADPATVHYDLALVHLTANQPIAALWHARQALEHNPSHEDARRIHKNLNGTGEP